jgi:hypothetical protein
MLTSIARLTLGLAAGLLLVACSDDGDKPSLDTGAPDQPVIDQSVGEGALPPDAGADQQVPDATQPDTSSPNADWTEVAAAPDMLYGVWGLDASHVYAVGKGGAIMTWDGTKWGAMTNSDKNDLYDVWGTSSTIFAVGDGVDLYWDGTTWNVGGSSYSTYSFRDMWGGSTNLFAVDGSEDIYYRSLSSTSSWSYAYGVTSEVTNGIWGVSETELYAVGDNGAIYTCTSSCSSYSANWTAMTVPTGVTSHLQAIWGSSGSDIFAVGFDGTILHYDGTSWTKMTTNTSTYFHDVWGSGPKDVWAVGNPVFQPDESIFHYDGTSWTKSSTPKPSTVLYGVWGSGATDVWAVGKTSILRYKK